MSGNCTWDVVEVCRPTATRLEFVVRFVEGRIAASASVDSGFRHVLVVFAGKGCFGAFFAEDAELF